MSNVKDMFSQTAMDDLGDKIERVYPDFQKEAFLKGIFSDTWEQMELFARLTHIAEILVRTLPNDYSKSLAIIYSVIPDCDLAQGMVFPPYVVEAGLNRLNDSAAALERITPHSTCEFAVRPFIDKYPDQMFDILMGWTQSENEHVRRLASEGSRLAIPWGSKLQTVKARPEYALPILEKLKDDPSEYVRKSVGNNLNELSKIAPDLVIKIGREWMGGSKNTRQIVKNACRTMIKKAYPPAMELFGLAKPEGISVQLLSVSPDVKVNDELVFSFEIMNESKEDIKLRIGYDLGYLKANGKINDKVNRISERMCKTGITAIDRKHKIAETSTRRIYPGRHELRITINGCVMAEAAFQVHE